MKINLFSPWYSWKIADLALNNNHSLTQAFLTGNDKIVHMCRDEDDDADGNVFFRTWHKFYGVHYNNACVKEENFWDVVKDSLARKNNSKDQECEYVFKNNIIILFLR